MQFQIESLPGATKAPARSYCGSISSGSTVSQHLSAPLPGMAFQPFCQLLGAFSSFDLNVIMSENHPGTD